MRATEKGGLLLKNNREDGSRTLILTVRVHPRSRKSGVEKLGPAEYKVQVTAPPEKGQANSEVLATLAAHFSIPVSRIRILRGEKSRVKFITMELDG
jgi:uncharacterized protein (TIGR00251 family)